MKNGHAHSCDRDRLGFLREADIFCPLLLIPLPPETLNGGQKYGTRLHTDAREQDDCFHSSRTGGTHGVHWLS